MHLLKSKKFIAISAAIVFIVAAILVYIFCIHPAFSGEKRSFNLYLLHSTGSSLSMETRSINVPERALEHDERMLSLLVEELINGPKEQIANKRAIPKETTLLSLKISADKIATVNFSKEFYAKTDLENNLAVCSVVLTLCDTGKVDKVAVLVDGKEIISKSKVPLGALGREDIVNASEPEKAAEPMTITLYFPSQDAQQLVSENRVLQIDGNKIDATLVLNELIKGTTIENAANLIPASTKVISCEVKENICYVNLSSDFIEKKTVTGASADALVIDSIVKTVTNLDGISKVMFLIEGEKLEAYGHLSFDEPLEPMSTEQEAVPPTIE